MDRPSHHSDMQDPNLETPQAQPRLPQGPWLSRLVLPLFVLQPLLTRIVRHVARSQPSLFARLDTHCTKVFVIDAIELPFVLAILPDPANPRLEARQRSMSFARDVTVRAPFRTLVEMIDGRADSDALFFNRDLHISGDTEAIVALRNALDDMDQSLVDEVLESFGPLKKPLRAAVNMFEKTDR